MNLVIHQTERQGSLVSEIKSKYKGEIQVINNAIYFVTLNDDYYKGTEAQYSAEISAARMQCC